MTNVLIRDIPPEDLEQIRSAAAAQGTSLQSFLREAVHAQAAYLRRQRALAATAARLDGTRPVPEGERGAVLDAVDKAHDDRAAELGKRPKK